MSSAGQKVEEGKVLKILARRGLGKIVLEEGMDSPVSLMTNHDVIVF